MPGLLLGIPLGVLSSLLAWYILVHGITPKIQFADKLSRLCTDGNGASTIRLKLLNSGWRHIIDCEVDAELRVKGLSRNLPRNTYLIRLPLRNGRFAYWPRGANRLIVFMPYHPDAKVAASLPIDNGNGFSLDELLRIREVVHLRIAVFAYDSFSGARRAFISKDYTQDDLVDGRYAADSLEIAPIRGASVHDGEDAD